MSINKKNSFPKKPDHVPPPQEEAIISASHAVGFVLSVIGSVILILQAVRSGDSYRVISFSIFGCSLAMLYLSSTLYHGFLHPRVRKLFKVMDHSSIYLLIAGSYTPFLLVGIRSQSSWIMFLVIWGLASIGILFKVFVIQRFHNASVVVYLLMGWLGVVMVREMIANIPVGGLILLGTGGLFYTFGVIFYQLKKIPYMHLVWHFFVLGGSISHYLAVLYYLA